MAVNGTCGGGGGGGSNGGAAGGPSGGGGAMIRCASPGCPHRRSSRTNGSGGRNGFQSQGSQTESRKKPGVTGAEQVRLEEFLLEIHAT